MSDIESLRHLWRRVLVQAVRDALGVRVLKDSSELVERERAQHWLEGRSEDFNHVCALSGYDPDMVRDWWRKVRADEGRMAAAVARIRDINGGAEAVRGGHNAA